MHVLAVLNRKSNKIPPVAVAPDMVMFCTSINHHKSSHETCLCFQSRWIWDYIWRLPYSTPCVEQGSCLLDDPCKSTGNMWRRYNILPVWFTDMCVPGNFCLVPVSLRYIVIQENTEKNTGYNETCQKRQGNTGKHVKYGLIYR